jgi:hypothetical protein
MNRQMLSALDGLLRDKFAARTTLNMDTLKLTASLSIYGGREEVNLMLFGNVDGYPVLVMNMPMVPWNTEFWKSFTGFLGDYGYQFPKPRIYTDEFRGYKIEGWEANNFNPIYVYLWGGGKGWGELRLNRLILEGKI